MASVVITEAPVTVNTAVFENGRILPVTITAGLLFLTAVSDSRFYSFKSFKVLLLLKRLQKWLQL